MQIRTRYLRPSICNRPPGVRTSPLRVLSRRLRGSRISFRHYRIPLQLSRRRRNGAGSSCKYVHGCAVIVVASMQTWLILDLRNSSRDPSQSRSFLPTSAHVLTGKRPWTRSRCVPNRRAPERIWGVRDGVRAPLADPFARFTASLDAPRITPLSVRRILSRKSHFGARHQRDSDSGGRGRMSFQTSFKHYGDRNRLDRQECPGLRLQRGARGSTTGGAPRTDQRGRRLYVGRIHCDVGLPVLAR